MTKVQLKTELIELTTKLAKATKARDSYEYEYEMEKCRMYFSAEVNAVSNQTLRDAQVNILLDEKGMYRKMAELRTDAKIAWYKWAAVKAIIDGNLA